MSPERGAEVLDEARPSAGLGGRRGGARADRCGPRRRRLGAGGRGLSGHLPGSPWSQDVSSGEAIRTNYDQTDQISPCHLQYLYQGVAPGSTQSYNLLPWRIGLLTQTNSTC
ncbi:MAG TPA: hypothetical protein VFU65_17735 [Actinocrinis sp.]|nr:hypothetical protein [Actinocrinis sp.]